MDRHQPAYWLSRGPDEAADFLARTAVASRTVGGLVKRAAGPGDFSLDPHLRQVLGNAALGAGIGGLGGLGVGLFSRRKKNPLTAALSGAAIGGVLGAAGPELYDRGRAWLNQPPGPPAGGAPTDLEKSRMASYDVMPAWKKLYSKLDPSVISAEAPAGPGGSTTPPQLDPVSARQARDPAGRLLLQATGEGLGSLGSGAMGLTSFDDQPVTSTLTHGALAAGQLQHWRGRRAYNQFQAGIDPLKKSQKFTPEVPETPGVATIPGQPGQPGYREVTTDATGRLTVRRTVDPVDPIDPVKGTEGKPRIEAVNPGTGFAARLAGRYQGEAGRAGRKTFGIGKGFREAGLGRRLMGLEGYGGERGLALSEARRLGESRLAERPPGRLRRGLEAGKYLAPHFLLQYGLNQLEPDQP